MRRVGSGFNFERVNALDHEELRPGYAPEAVTWVSEAGGLAEGDAVVDLAAGTGQSSRRFALLGVEVVAVEPAANMRAILADAMPAIRVLDGTAESIPLRDGVAPAVVVGNAFHHFDAEHAFADIRRVLRSGGAFALFWAWPGEGEHERYPILEEVDRAVEAARGSSPIVAAYRRWSEAPGRAEGFTPFERRSFPMTHVLPSARLADLYATSSDVASIPVAERSKLLDEIRRLAAGLPETLELPARSDVDLCKRD